MIYSQSITPANKILSKDQVIETLNEGLGDKFQNQRVLVLIPDHTRSLPLPFLFRALVEILANAVQLDFMVAPGTHPSLAEESLNRLVGITKDERGTTYKHVRRWVDKLFQRVLSCAPLMYDELWTGAKAMYKLEPAVAVGGEVVIYAPHLDVVSHVHGRYIYEVGYHTLPYFLNDWERFKHIPLGVLAHSTHVRGSGVMEDGIEKPNVRVTLASKISEEDCARLNLGYLDPEKVNVDEWKVREDEGVLYVPKAGEILYRLKT